MPNPPRLDVRMGVGNVRVPSARRLSVRTSDLRAVSGDFSGDFPATAKMTVLPLIFFFRACAVLAWFRLSSCCSTDFHQTSGRKDRR